MNGESRASGPDAGFGAPSKRAWPSGPAAQPPRAETSRISCRPHRTHHTEDIPQGKQGHVGALNGKVTAITGSGRGIGRAVALACAAEGAAVVVNDYGVSMDGNEPTSEVADEVVAEIKAAGGKAV